MPVLVQVIGVVLIVVVGLGILEDGVVAVIGNRKVESIDVGRAGLVAVVGVV